ncbi:Uncharacterized protein APZ42_013066 [Daphnia magna]|uniref:Uncharacterized protein n=1 Tax=Daphnia magna TaxID=35525 RepID=A0A162R7D4_9CRUS|nr:Uncharacterized protein APZ42_013066 [Daphnia magna]
MIQSLLTLKDAVDGALKAMDKTELLLTANEWNILAGSAEMLKPFDEVTTDLSSQYYPSISKVIPSIRILQHNLGALNITGCCPILKKMSSDLLANISNNRGTIFESWDCINNKMFLFRFKKNRIYLSPGIQGGGEMAEKRVEKELRLAINQGSTENVAVEISLLPNTCSSFHDSMIRTVNTARTGESSDVTTCVTVNIRDYLRKPYLPWSTDPLDYWLMEKKAGCIRPFIDVVNFFFVFPLLPYHQRCFFLLLAILFGIKEADLVQTMLICSSF